MSGLQGPTTHPTDTAAHAGTSGPPPKISPEMCRPCVCGPSQWLLPEGDVQPREGAVWGQLPDNETARRNLCVGWGWGGSGRYRVWDPILPGQCSFRIDCVEGELTQTRWRTSVREGPDKRTRVAVPPAIAVVPHNSVFPHVSYTS